MVGALPIVGGPAVWIATDRLEARNEFCVSCHLDPETPLHEHLLESFKAVPARSLAAAHHGDADGNGSFKCIDCHGGSGPAGRVRAKLLAARDVVLYFAGRFDEPDHLTVPLRDEDCSQCHATYEPERPDDFHALEDHNIGLPFRCTECHRAHPVGASASLRFLERETVLPVCRQCHEEF